MLTVTCRLPSWTSTEQRTKSKAARAKQHELTKTYVLLRSRAVKRAFREVTNAGKGVDQLDIFIFCGCLRPFKCWLMSQEPMLRPPPPPRPSSCTSNLPGRSKQHTTWTRSIIFRPPTCDVRVRLSDWRRLRGKRRIHSGENLSITNLQNKVTTSTL